MISRRILPPYISNTSQNARFKNVPSFRCVRTNPSATTTSSSSVKTCDGDGGAADKTITFDVPVERCPTTDVECTGDLPLNIIRQARKNLLMVASPEAVQVPVDRLLVLYHV
jgi:hypothetical protein